MGARYPILNFSAVMAGLVPAIHSERQGNTFTSCPKRFGVDARDKLGHDGSDRSSETLFHRGRRGLVTAS